MILLIISEDLRNLDVSENFGSNLQNALQLAITDVLGDSVNNRLKNKTSLSIFMKEL